MEEQIIFQSFTKETGLKDINGRDIEIGDVVEWDDSEGKRTAEVIRCRDGQIGFYCFKNSRKNWAIGHTFKMKNFIYADTNSYLKIVRKSQNDNKRRLY